MDGNKTIELVALVGEHLIDGRTEPLFEVGTCNIDDYYPGFVATWNPIEAAP